MIATLQSRLQQAESYAHELETKLSELNVKHQKSEQESIEIRAKYQQQTLELESLRKELATMQEKSSKQHDESEKQIESIRNELSSLQTIIHKHLYLFKHNTQDTNHLLCNPWYNGTAEWLIAVVKRCLKTFDNEFKSMEDARSIFLKIESTINGRPLIQNDERWLSPFEVAYGRKQEPLIKNNVEIGNVNKWMVYLSTIRNKFERLWKQQYLNTLAQRNPPRSMVIKPGDFVLLPAEYQKRKDWPLAKIISSLSQATMASYAPLKSNYSMRKRISSVP